MNEPEAGAGDDFFVVGSVNIEVLPLSPFSEMFSEPNLCVGSSHIVFSDLRVDGLCFSDVVVVMVLLTVRTL